MSVGLDEGFEELQRWGFETGMKVELLGGANGSCDGVVGVGIVTGTCEEVDDGGVRGEGVVAEGIGLGPEEEAECEVGFVEEMKCDLGELGGVDAVGTERTEGAPARLGTLVG